MTDDLDSVIAAYRKNLPLYASFANKVRDLVDELLVINKTKFHFVEARAKSPESLTEKLQRPGKSYSNPLSDIPDLVGVRVVLYYSDDVAKIGKMLKGEFELIGEELGHQPKGLSADRFGYLSLHCVLRLATRRSKLSEWSRYKGLHFELQLRTVLQHSWAAVSHALQYKKEGDVPHELRRKLHRLAGLFELADEEFLELRDLAAEKAREASVAVKKGVDEIGLDISSLQAFVRQWKPLKDVLNELEARGINPADLEDVRDEEEPHNYLGDIVEHCERIGIRTISELKKMLSKDFTSFVEYVAEPRWCMGVEFVLYLLLIASRPKDFSVEILTHAGFHENIAKRVLNAAAKAQT
ncbi:hypothetical protein CMV30_17070 [Nibricoccus aquaticus]|uniref:RelA/SpoT domain-containing protein n=1 Tax=Nibricoccus aquaticus TaxID=2576891 RepID=A0A290QLX3_9BACT|nr:hypothetical protein [Nibricoccus aquaticus]ATC65521.1 hypothetical protein CMV30_17070 [Nibricoccus aquaticus]